MRRADYAAACEAAASDPRHATRLLNALASELYRYKAQTRTETIALEDVFEAAIAVVAGNDG